MENDPKAHFFLGMMGIGIIVLLVSGPLIDSKNMTSLLVQCFGILLLIWAFIAIKASKRHHKLPKGYFFVVSGPYEIIRHPMYAGIILIFSSLLQYDFSLLRVLAFFLLLAGIFMKVLREETLLTNKLTDYKEYKKKTKIIIPYLF